MWNRRARETAHLILGLLLSLTFILESSPLMAGPNPVQPIQSARATLETPSRSPGYLPSEAQLPQQAPSADSLPPALPAADAPSMNRIYLPLVSSSAALPMMQAAAPFNGEIPLASGWNLISLPEMPDDPGVEAVLAAIGGRYSEAFAYRACEAEPWQRYDPANPSSSTLHQIDSMLGFWVRMSEASQLPLQGQAQLSTTLHLCAGWNLVGYPLSTPQLLSTALTSIAGKYSRVIAYDAFDALTTQPDPWEVHNVASPLWANDLSLMQPGRGYWIFATQDADLTFAEPASYDILPPTVIVTATPSIVNVGEAVLLSLSATDNELIASRELTVNGVTVALDRGGQAWYTPTGEGLYNVVGSAKDGVGNASGKTTIFRVRSSSDNGAPIVALSSPATDAIIIDKVELIGTASDSDLVFYTLEAKPADGTTYSEFQRGQSPIVNNPLGTLIPGMFPPGMVDVRVCAEDSWGARSCSPANRYDFGNQIPLPGVMRFGAVDAELTASGIPLRISRIYDSRLKSSGDFGIGWRMETSELRLYANRLFGNDWQQIFIPGVPVAYALQATADHRVTIVLPDGSIHRFRMKPNPEVQAVARITSLSGAMFEPISNTTSSLVAVELPAFVDSGTPTTGNPSPALLLDAGFNIYNPTNYRLTLANGTRLDFVRNGAINVLTYRLAKINDPNGNSVTIASNGITHSAGIGLTITRDGSGRITSIKNPKGDSRTYGYDSKGRLIFSKDWDGYETKYSYDDANHLVAVTDARGYTPGSFVYNELGQVVAVVDSDGNRTEFNRNPTTGEETVTDSNGRTTITRYDERGRPIQVTDALGGVTRYSYDVRDNLLTVSDPLGNVTTSTYDGRNNKLSETNVLSQTTRFTYDGNDRLLSRTDALGNVTRYAYDAKGNLLTVTNALGEVTSRSAYDTKGNVISITNAVSSTTRFQYDSVGRRTVITDALGGVEKYGYNANGQVTSTIDRRGISTTLTLDKRGNFVQMLNSLGTLARFNWDARGSLSEVIDPTGQTTGTRYDERGRAIEENAIDGRTLQREFDSYNNLLSTTDSAGRTTLNTYDNLNRLIKTVAADGGTIESVYDAAGRRIRTIDAAGSQTQIEYDGLGRTVRITDSVGSVTRFGYDVVGNLTTVIDAAGRTFVTVYDDLNRVVAQNFPDGKSVRMGYDSAGRVVSMSDELERTTTYEYDTLNRLVKVIDPNGGQTNYTYDSEGHLLSQSDANQHTTYFAYDGAGRRILTTYPDGATVGIGYDSLGRMDVITDALGLAVRFEYDAFHRVTDKVYPDNSRVSFDYDVNSQLATITDARGITRYRYDLLGRLSAVDNPDGSSLRYTFDLSGNRTAVEARISPTAPPLITRYSYDALSRLQSITDPIGVVTSYLYDANGNRSRVNYANGSYTRYGYDLRNRLTMVEHGKSATVYERFSYTLDAVGDRTRLDQLDGSYTIYGYDNLRRLRRETQYNASSVKTLDVSYTYDAVGNRTSKFDHLASRSISYSYDAADKLLSSSDASYSYDANGNLIQEVRGTVITTYSYDYDNRLIQVSTSTGSVTTYGYDHGRNRIVRNDGNGTIRYLVDMQDRSGLPQVLAEYSGNILLVNYVYGDDLISQRRGSVTSYYHYDGNNSTRLLTNGAGVVTDRYSFDAYGLLINLSGSTVNSYLYSGEQFDPNSGFYYLRARYYSPENGRFTSRDLIHGDSNEPVSLHRYLYGAANPVMYVDPSGLEFSIVNSVTVSAIIGGLVNLGIDVYRQKSPREILVNLATNVIFALGFGAAGAWVFGKIGPALAEMLRAAPLLIHIIKSFISAVLAVAEEFSKGWWNDGTPPTDASKMQNLALVFFSSLLFNLAFFGGARKAPAEVQSNMVKTLAAKNPELGKRLFRLARMNGFSNFTEFFSSGIYYRNVFDLNDLQDLNRMYIDELAESLVGGGFKALEGVKEALEIVYEKVYGLIVCIGGPNSGASTDCGDAPMP